MNKMNLFKASFLLLFMSVFVSCSEDEDDMNSGNPDEGYTTGVYLTDAPIDEADVQAAFVTVANVKVNGQAVEGFEKTTIELSSLQNGETTFLGDVELESGTTSSITLVLDNETDASGAAPGSYVLTTGGEKKALATASNEINISDEAEILASEENQLILDFDLRKAIVSNTEGEYSFVGDASLSNSIRAVNSFNAGTINGNVEDNGSSDEMLVFAYQSGTYSESETEANADGTRFANAVTSAKVGGDGEFSLHFLEEGDYELHFASYSQSEAGLTFEGMLEASAISEIDLSAISVNAETETTVEVSIDGILGL